MTSLDKLTKAKLLLNACFELENRYEDGYRTLESDYSLPEEFWSDCQMDELKLISLTKSTFSDLDDDGFLSSLLGADSGLNSSYGSFTATISFLKTYIDSVHPVYLDDLLRDAEKLRDSNYHLCAIHNIRLFCETVLRNKYPQYRRKDDTLGNMVHDLKKQFGNDFESVMSKIRRMNSIVHNDDDHKATPVTSNEITMLIRWASEFERLVHNFDQSRIPKLRVL